MHHHYKKPFSLSAFYMSNIEIIYVAVISIQLPIIFLDTHWITLCIISFAGTLYFFASHSGYGKYTFISGDRHDIHHEKFEYNYSNFEFIDKLLGINMTR